VEIGKLFAHRFFTVVLVVTVFVTIALGIAAISISSGSTGADAGQGSDGQTFKNYSLWAGATSFSLRVGIMLLVALGAMSMASEATARTLNTMLTRPVRRFEFALAKALTLLFATVCVIASAAATGYIIGGTIEDKPRAKIQAAIDQAIEDGRPVEYTLPERSWWEMSYGHIRDRKYPAVVIAPKQEVMSSIVLGFVLLAIPVLAATSVSFLVGTLLDSVGLAIGVSIGLFVALEATRFVPGASQLFSNYLYNYPMSRVEALMGVAAIGSPPIWSDVTAGLAVSGLYVVVSFAIAITIFCRRDVTL
jgi:ABC-type transport system involved in multi-copper enzyme maturation permease subunit